MTLEMKRLLDHDAVAMEASKTVPRINMTIQPIPPFRGGKKATSNEGKPAQASGASAGGSPAQPMSPTSAQRLNVNASSFRPNPKAVAFTPVTSVSVYTNCREKNSS